MSSEMCLDILKQSSCFEIKNIKVNYSHTLDDVEKISFKKITGYIIVVCKIIFYSIAFKPDLVYMMPATAGFAFIRDFSFSLLLKFLNRNIVFHLRTQLTEKDKKSAVKRYIFKIVFNNSGLIVLGKELEKDILAYLKNGEIFILPNAIPKTLRCKDYVLIEADRQSSKKLRLVFISNMFKSKGWPKTIEAAKILNMMDLDFSLTFAGSWPSDIVEKEFFNLIKKYNLENRIEYLGYVNKEKKNNLLANSDILIFPTEYKYEALPRVIIEAYEYGIPVISTRNGSIPSIISHNKTGFLVSSDIPGEIADHVISLSRKKYLVDIGREARKTFLSKYQLSVYRKGFLDIIQKVI